jgi:co-chaperonin GroES (HSP10)
MYGYLKDNIMAVRPLGKKVLVAENKRDNQTASGIILEGGQGLGESKTGTVIAIGPEVTQVQVGDKILLDWSKAQMATVDGAQRVMILEDNIVAVLSADILADHEC